MAEISQRGWKLARRKARLYERETWGKHNKPAGSIKGTTTENHFSIVTFLERTAPIRCRCSSTRTLANSRPRAMASSLVDTVPPSRRLTSISEPPLPRLNTFPCECQTGEYG